MSQTSSATTTVLDPVCGMFVDPAAAAATSTYGGETYAFCAVSCKTAFDADPEAYVTPKAGASTASCCDGHACCTAR